MVSHPHTYAFSWERAKAYECGLDMCNVPAILPCQALLGLAWACSCFTSLQLFFAPFPCSALKLGLSSKPCYVPRWAELMPCQDGKADCFIPPLLVLSALSQTIGNSQCLF